MTFKQLLFGTAGTPICSKERSSIAGINTVRKLGLDCMELEFVRGVRMSLETAKDVKKAAQENDITLTAHAPYYVNLNSLEVDKQVASIKRILDTAIIANHAGAFSITFHPAFYMKQNPELVYKKVRQEMQKIVDKLKQLDIKLWLRPETTGKGTQFGSYKEIISLSQELDQVLPCIDFAHLHARTGKLNSYDEFHKILSDHESALGKDFIRNMHNHISGIHYSDKGELHHLILKESDLRYKELLKALKEFDAKGVVICESPNIEQDSLIMQKYYKSL